MSTSPPGSRRPAAPAINAARIQARLAVPRVATYLDACQGDLDRALLLYRWNASLAGALWETLGHAEVLLRNAIHDALTTRHGIRRNAGFWFDDVDRELDQRARDEIISAKRRAHRSAGAGVPPGKIVAELPFGFWRYLLARRYSSTLWPAIRHAFPHLPGRDRVQLERPVIRLHQVRNRIAHHEPLVREDIPARIADLEAVLDAIDPALRAWVRDDGGRLGAIVRRRP